MLRKLVTLLAFLTGIAALGAPIQAGGRETSGVVAAAELRTGCVNKQTRRGGDRKRPAAESGSARQPCRKPAPSILYFPPVMLQADRARE